MLTFNKQKYTKICYWKVWYGHRLLHQSCLEHSSTQIQCYEPGSLPRPYLLWCVTAPHWNEGCIWLDIKANWHDISCYDFVKAKCTTGEMLNKYISEENSLVWFSFFIYLPFSFNEKVKWEGKLSFLTNSMYKILFCQAKTIQQQCLLKYK